MPIVQTISCTHMVHYQLCTAGQYVFLIIHAFRFVYMTARQQSTITVPPLLHRFVRISYKENNAKISLMPFSLYTNHTIL